MTQNTRSTALECPSSKIPDVKPNICQDQKGMKFRPKASRAQNVLDIPQSFQKLGAAPTPEYLRGGSIFGKFTEFSRLSLTLETSRILRPFLKSLEGPKSQTFPEVLQHHSPDLVTNSAITGTRRI